MHTFKVSVCVVTYNQKKYIRQCLQSIVDQQTSFDFEIIVGDDASTDGTREIIDEFQIRYPQLIKPIFHTSNIGPFDNYRYVHRIACGEYIAHLDGDDYWLPGKLTYQVAFLDEHLQCAAVYTNANVISDNDVHLGIFTGKVDLIFDTSYLLSRGNFLCHSSMLYRSKFGLFAFDCVGNFIDFYIHEKLSEKGLLGFVNVPFVVYRYESCGSMIKTRSEYIRILYLHVFREADRSTLNIKSLYSGMATFLVTTVLSDMYRGLGLRYSGVINFIRSMKFLNTTIFAYYVLFTLFRVIYNRILSRLFSKEKIFNPRY